MTTQIVILGGNGYLGRELTKLWLQKDALADFWILSRSGKNQLVDPRIHNRAVDLTDFEAVKQVLPAEIDYIVDLIGRPEKSPALSTQVNDQPAQLMRKLAETAHCQAMGFVGGQLGPKAFLKTKADLIQYLQQSDVPLAYVEPTLVYGAGRQDTMMKMVPLLTFLGRFSAKLKPVAVEVVVNQLYTQLMQLGHD
ncbi:NAD-dependent epimerase/dehydratase family protein [Lactiplantibacillus mudanjiangensis]|uniref:NADH(P)-binding domain containing-protein [Lactobacillus oligofermentans DSM = LMG 22743] n=1 Tax=Lactiplantibacillus mudanjiangensis TaxID=1296538 RepID=A0A660DZ00_9LACO|nr:NAD-dependent epimerase/dehydratase family protein [Lactiplantibacillus mudanjiangensis]VDG19636.1 NADH(P)-binding domain containing-protein [Lactobacillus oligofermentans DSM = LMG 22743] [Lactiplantibacillus mudanjiangensis]VDG25440.1 NADH(P)-binding domain containing-protein [Lactobacillus oligofermentans DSM = LMG 22743] [Lactiplantibacillus mudanjiangensis]VDG28532.1 NADH(P)-binding domain containing-protein [Lactobacillus oligofermentans DSM = LMG 22743] [Lactiplantibacillus mudanjiange